VREIDAVLLRLTALPVITMDDVAIVAVLLTVRVRVLVPLVVTGAKVALTPSGTPEADKVTLPLNPYRGATAMVLMALLPCGMLKVLGLAESVKLGGGTMVTDTCVEAVKPPEAPVTTMLAWLTIVAALAVIVKTLEVDVLVVLKAAVMPAGTPEADRATVPLNPFCAETVMVLLPPLLP
jgi:hypothetical protein